MFLGRINRINRILQPRSLEERRRVIHRDGQDAQDVFNREGREEGRCDGEEWGAKTSTENGTRSTLV